jgi:fructose-bisphosphate aldolase class I
VASFRHHHSAAGAFADELVTTANTIASAGRGILAADESEGTIGKRFDAISVDNTQPNRRDYRELLVRTPGLSEYISGVILFEETLYDSAADGTPLVDIIKAAGIVPGIKVDKGVVNIPGTTEDGTQGLTDLDKRCADYYAAGARFSKWRATIKVGCEGLIPTERAVEENAFGLARYAAISQAHGLVPIVEPEVLVGDGSHDVARAAEVSEHAYSAVFRQLHQQGVLLEGMLLKPNMCYAGADCANQASAEEIACFTMRTLQRTVPPAVPGITFLSGGQSEEGASVNLSNLNAMEAKRPWRLSFSYGRALQKSVLAAWKGDPANVGAAQDVLLQRARANSEAQLGTYTGDAGGAAASESLYIKGYKY